MKNELILINQRVIQLLKHYEIDKYIEKEHQYSGMIHGSLWLTWFLLEVGEDGNCEKVFLGVEGSGWYLKLDSQMALECGYYSKGIEFTVVDDDTPVMMLKTITRIILSDLEKELGIFGAKEGASILGSGLTPIDMMGGYQQESRDSIKQYLYEQLKYDGDKEIYPSDMIIAQAPIYLEENLFFGPNYIGMTYIKLDHEMEYAEIQSCGSPEINKIRNSGARWWSMHSRARNIFNLVGSENEKIIISPLA